MTLTCSRDITSTEALNDMMTNYERVMKTFIPAFRLKAAKMMVKEYGLKQQQAAMMLGTTQAAISKYLKEDSNKFADVKIDDRSLRQFVDRMKDEKEQDGKRIMCAMCQSNKKFGCSFMVK